MNPCTLGFAQVDITPDRPLDLVGYGRPDERSRGVLSPLIAQVAVWTLDNVRVCLAAIDHIGFSQENCDRLRDGIAAAIGATRERVMLCFSHTHSAPNDSAARDYAACVRAKIIQAAGAALEGGVPVEGAWGNARAHVGLNRRAGDAAMDDRLGVLKLCDMEGRPRLIVLRVTAHNNALKADNYLISADFFGAARDLIAARYGCPVMITQGASGDVAPKYFASEIDPPDADERFTRCGDALNRLAQSLLDDLIPVADALVPRPITRLAAYARALALTADVPTMARAREVADEALRYAGIPGESWLAAVRALNDAGITEQTCATEVQYLYIGEGCLCGVANEILTGFALRVREKLGAFFYFGGYTNGCLGYFPTETAFDEGGFEVYWSMLIYFMYYDRVFPFRRESAGALIDFVIANA